LHPEREKCSEYEGGPLPLFKILPRGDKFFFVRIVWEPTAVFVATTILANFAIISSGLAFFLHFAALCLVMKEFIDWYSCWLGIRINMDMTHTGPIIAKLMNNTATDEELAQVHLASFPKDLSPELRESAVANIERKFRAQIPTNH
jgi:hypothetical protein